jgi:hypothetical protein
MHLRRGWEHKPYQVEDDGADEGLRPDVLGDPNANVPSGLAFNPAVFATPAPFVEGDAARNSLRGPM